MSLNQNSRTNRNRSTSKYPTGSNANTVDSDQENVASTLKRFAPKITWCHLDDLAPAPKNARTHSDKQIAQIAASITQFGFTNPVLIGDDSKIIAGHGRVAAAKKLGLDAVPVIQLDHLSADERRAYIVADNRLAELAGWDRELLAIELKELSTIDLGFDVELTGFEVAEIDLMIEDLDRGDNPEDNVPAPEANMPPTSQAGDLWKLGDHRLICGDALDPTLFERLMGQEEADLVAIDPPFNVKIDGHVCGLGTIRHREFVMAAGEMSEAEFTDFLQRSLANHGAHCRDGAVIFCFMDWRHLFELQTAARQVKLSTLNLCIWRKINAGMGALYRSQHELILVLKKGTAPHQNNVQLGRYGRYRTNVWTYEGANSIRANRREELALHPTVKPVALVADAIKDVTRRGDLVLDGFAGSGTTILAAQKTGRRCYAVELDPGYVDVAIRRWQSYTGATAIHAESGSTFDDLAASRTAEPARPVRKRRKPSTAEA